MHLSPSAVDDAIRLLEGSGPFGHQKEGNRPATLEANAALAVAVLGGGLQGACVALELAAGVDVDIYDMRDRCGTQAAGVSPADRWTAW